MNLIHLSVGPLATNCYIVQCPHTLRGLVIDPGDEAPLILETLATHGVQLDMIILTHAHFDHTGAAAEVRTATGAPIAIHQAEADMLAHPIPLFPGLRPPPAITADHTYHEDEVVAVGEIRARVLATPGHSSGGLSLWVEKDQVLFSGDALFREGVGRTDLPGGSAATLARSIQAQLYVLPEETVVYPGHGSRTTIGWEMRHNPYVRPPGAAGQFA